MKIVLNSIRQTASQLVEIVGDKVQAMNAQNDRVRKMRDEVREKKDTLETNRDEMYQAFLKAEEEFILIGPEQYENKYKHGKTPYTLEKEAHDQLSREAFKIKSQLKAIINHSHQLNVLIRIAQSCFSLLKADLYFLFADVGNINIESVQENIKINFATLRLRINYFLGMLDIKGSNNADDVLSLNELKNKITLSLRGLQILLDAQKTLSISKSIGRFQVMETIDCRHLKDACRYYCPNTVEKIQKENYQAVLLFNKINRTECIYDKFISILTHHSDLDLSSNRVILGALQIHMAELIREGLLSHDNVYQLNLGEEIIPQSFATLISDYKNDPLHVEKFMNEKKLEKSEPQDEEACVEEKIINESACNFTQH